MKLPLKGARRKPNWGRTRRTQDLFARSAWRMRKKKRQSDAPLPFIPTVHSSIIGDTSPDSILVQWDRPMRVSCDIIDQINVIIDGAPAVHPDHVAFDISYPSTMGIVMAAPFAPGQVITWSYDDTGLCELQEIALPNTEADNQTYAVNNNLVAPNNTEFDRADVETNPAGAGVIVTLSDDKGYASQSAEWQLKVNGVAFTGHADLAVSGHDTRFFRIELRDSANYIVAGDVVTVSHLVADSGIKQFTDQPADNSLVSDGDFVSALVDDSSKTEIIVTLSEDVKNPQDALYWEVKINGSAVSSAHGSYLSQKSVYVDILPSTVASGDVVLVSHLVDDGYTKIFTDQPVTNNVT